jgi:parallel beta-helix repeat protein
MSRTGIILLCLSLSVLIASVAAAGPVVPATTVPAPDDGLKESAGFDLTPRATVAAFPYVITVPGTYSLDRDYLNLAVPVAIDVQCSNVVIDGGGHTLDGGDFTDSVGIRVHGSAALTGVTVKNLIVTDWGQGVHFWNARGRIEGVTASSNTGFGILLYTGGDATVITGCTVESNGAGGISVSFAPAVEISSCTVRNNVDDGVYVYESNNARITGTTASGNTLSGIALLGSAAGRITGAVISGCRASANGKAGIYMNRAQANTVVNNRFENTRNVLLEGTEIGANTWNTPKTAGTNIAGGAWLGGNWWSGFSESAADADRDGLADRAYAISTGNSDALPLVSAPNDFAIWPGMIITVPGTYTLNQDLLLPENAGRAIVIEIKCSNVVIEGNGHRISSGGLEGWCGVYVNNPNGAATGITIRNLTVSNSYYGIYLVNTDASRIERCRIDDTSLNGMRLILSQGSDGNTITGNRIIAGPTSGPETKGLYIVSSSQNTITNNEISTPVNVVLVGTVGPNTWNVAKTAGANILGGAYLGGNYWAEPDGTGWSQQVADADHDGIGDSPYALAAGNSDGAPLVKARPDANFTAVPTTGGAPLAVQFTDTSTGSPISWSWSFGDGATSTQRHPNHTYAAAGTYTVSLTVGNADGLSDTESRTGLITVWALGVASIAPNTGMQGSTVAVTNLAGTEFRPGATVKLTRAGSADVPAANVIVVSPTRITCQFGISSMAATGPWNVVVTNRDGRNATLPNGFTVARISPLPTNVTFTGEKIVIAQPGSYLLTNDITNSNLATCIEIRASNVVFDGGGHLIDGLDTGNSVGIYVHGPTAPVSNVTIRNVRAQDWWYGVSLHQAGSSRVESSTLSSNGFSGAVVYQNAAANTIAGCTITGNDYGVAFLDGAANGVVSENRIAQNARGLYVYLSDGITIMRNTIAESGTAGIQFHISAGGTVYDNRLENALNVAFTGEPFCANAWSVSPGPEWAPANVLGGPRIGGNYWSAPDGTGFSQTNPDANGDGFVDTPLQIAEQNFDYSPLALYTDPGTVTPTPTATPGVVVVPGGSGMPGDPNTDGKYDDVNGNGRKDFADIVLYFNSLSWIAANEPVSAFDYNGNGRIDFADVVWLFNHL